MTDLSDAAKLEVTSEYLRESLEAIAMALGVPIAGLDGPRANDNLLHDILGTIHQRQQGDDS